MEEEVARVNNVEGADDHWEPDHIKGTDDPDKGCDSWLGG